MSYYECSAMLHILYTVIFLINSSQHPLKKNHLFSHYVTVSPNLYFGFNGPLYMGHYDSHRLLLYKDLGLDKSIFSAHFKPKQVNMSFCSFYKVKLFHQSEIL